MCPHRETLAVPMGPFHVWPGKSRSTEMCRVPESRSPGLFRTLNEWDRGYGEWTTEIGEDKKTPKNADPNVEQNVEQNVQPVRTWWKFWQWLGLWEKEPEKRNTARPRLAFLPSHHISKQLDSPWTQIPRIHAILRTVLIRSCCPCVSWCILMYLNVSWCILFNFLDRYWRKGKQNKIVLTYVDICWLHVSTTLPSPPPWGVVPRIHHQLWGKIKP